MAATTTTRLRLPLALVLGLAACGDDGDPPPLPREPDCSEKAIDAVTNGRCQVQIGNGAESFTPLAGGETVDLIHGPQGGIHVWGAFRVRGTPEAHVHYVDFRLETPDGKQLARTPYCPDLQYSEVQDGWRAEWGHTVILLPSQDPTKLDGSEAVLRVSVDDLGGEDLCAPTPPDCRAAACVRVKLHDTPPG